MSFDIGSVPPAAAAAPTGGGAAGARRTSGPAPALDEAVRVDTSASTPPPEVHQAMAKAAQNYEKLEASGHQLSFHLDDRTGKVRIEVHNLQGEVLFTVPPSKALQIAGDGVLG